MTPNLVDDFSPEQPGIRFTEPLLGTIYSIKEENRSLIFVTGCPNYKLYQIFKTLFKQFINNLNLELVNLLLIIFLTFL